MMPLLYALYDALQVFSFITTMLTMVLSPQGGNTALIWAARYGHREIVSLLLDRGAQTEATNKVRRKMAYDGGGVM